jgi:hypothetical protein
MDLEGADNSTDGMSERDRKKILISYGLLTAPRNAVDKGTLLSCRDVENTLRVSVTMIPS